MWAGALVLVGFLSCARADVVNPDALPSLDNPVSCEQLRKTLAQHNIHIDTVQNAIQTSLLIHSAPPSHAASVCAPLRTKPLGGNLPTSGD
jgi:hypothetical protein